jgi:glycosyltransferase involved in cell wall biosynthesis
MKITVVIVALNESEFIQPCIKALYPFVDRIKIQTNYDRSWSGELITPDQTVEKILEFPDPAGKIALHITRIPDEAIARNWIMRSDSYRIDHPHQSTTSTEESIKNFCEGSNYFWIVDADEVYDPKTIPNILDYLKNRRPQILRIRGINYFKSWNYEISPSDNFYQAGLIQSKVLFRENRNLGLSAGWELIKRIIHNKYWNVNRSFSKSNDAWRGIINLSEEIGIFHHAAYVGSDSRILKKISCSVHHDPRMNQWYENVWKKWTPEMKNLHPLNPEVFPGVRYVPTHQLPSSITNQQWPEEYLEQSTLAQL